MQLFVVLFERQDQVPAQSEQHLDLLGLVQVVELVEFELVGLVQVLWGLVGLQCPVLAGLLPVLVVVEGCYSPLSSSCKIHKMTSFNLK
jgi:hypothetical protein